MSKNYPCFGFFPDTEQLYQAAQQVSLEIGPLLLLQKNVFDDVKTISNAIYSVLIKHGLRMEHDILYENGEVFFQAILYHDISLQQHEQRYLFSGKETKRSRAFLAIKACVDLLGLDIVNDETVVENIGLKSRDTITISFTDIENYFKCPRCFYLAKKSIKMPFIMDEQFDIPNANDIVLKKEFDVCRKFDQRHPIMEQNGIDAIPLKNTNIDKWRNSNYGNGGIRFFDAFNNILFSGVVDDLWVNQQGDFIIVDYKTTAKESISLEDEMGSKYRRQISFYGWLLRQNSYTVHSVGYLLIDKPQIELKKHTHNIESKKSEEYAFNVFAPADQYQRLLTFKTTLLEVSLDYSWVAETFDEIILCLRSNEIPMPFRNRRKNKACATCEYQFKVRQYENRLAEKQSLVKGVES